MLIGSISYMVENIHCAGPIFQMEHIFYGYSGLRAINFVIVSSAPTSGSKSQVSIYFCYPKSTEIKPGISEDLQEVKCLGERRSPWTKHQGGSLHSRAAKNQEMYQQTPPHQSLQNVVTVYMLINSFHRKLCPPRINHQGQRRERDTQRKLACLLGVVPWAPLAVVVFHLYPMQGDRNMALGHFTCILRTHLVNIIRGRQVIPDDIVHYKFDSSFQEVDSLTRKYPLISSCQQTAGTHRAFPRHGGCKWIERGLPTSEAHTTVGGAREQLM